MTDDVCESWEDVDVDKIVIKNPKSNPIKRPTYSSILTTRCNQLDNRNEKFSPAIDELNGSSPSTPSLSSSSFKILRRVSDPNDSNSPFINQPKIVLEDNNSTQLVKSLRILNRPTNKNAETKTVDTVKNSEIIEEKLKKSFEEKQAEYAKARLRILGEVMPAEDLVLNMNDSLRQVILDDPSCKINRTKVNVKSQNIFGAQMDCSGNINPQLPFIRQPIAPDGTKGFNQSK
ncbi:hypothetical protein QR98_0041140 [Sarcoptes scabiei]|uniref:Uncharacterized protein n=1 Tax=Sarcoptes scabiei TaxID=52283 RepID=A0A132A3S4_SARSC|nr:hypothetical protein QR98_0041140 [Sarcoptes scabiei]